MYYFGSIDWSLSNEDYNNDNDKLLEGNENNDDNNVYNDYGYGELMI